MAELTLGVFSRSRKENELRLPLHPSHFERIDETLRKRIFLEEGYAGWFDESQADPTLQARTVLGGLLVTRRLKHFSDYALWVGLGSYNVTSGLGGEIWGGW